MNITHRHQCAQAIAQREGAIAAPIQRWLEHLLVLIRRVRVDVRTVRLESMHLPDLKGVRLSLRKVTIRLLFEKGVGLLVASSEVAATTWITIIV